jgi:GT2 family glycosyltransferase
MHLLLELAAWLVALIWVWRVVDAHRGLPGIPDLLRSEHDHAPAGLPALTVIVPARNEAKDIRACLTSLLQQDYPAIDILAVNDRSNDATGAIMDELAASHPAKLRVLHVESLPPEWLGKTHAMALAARQTASEFLLFTDADVLFAPDSLRRALAYAVEANADHLVLMPTTIIHRWDEAGLLAFFQIFSLWGPRLWRVADPRAQRDALGIGAFNLLRRTAYEAVGGYESLRMEIVEDLGLARRIKRAGLRQRVAFGRDLVRLHWAAGVPGLIQVMTKNIFAAVNFRIPLLLGGCAWLLGFCILPFVLVWDPAFTLPALVSIAAIAWGFVLMGRPSGLSAWNALLAPFAAAIFVFTMLRSMLTTLRQGGVIWRGTFYSLAMLRKHLAPLV